VTGGFDETSEWIRRHSVMMLKKSLGNDRRSNGKEDMMARKSSKARKTRTTRHHEVDVTLLHRNLPALVHSMTFAHMVQKNTAFAHAIKDLRWLFPPVCQRKDQSGMTETERSRYICAFNMINNDGTLGQLVDTHAEMHMQCAPAPLASHLPVSI
jgi:hypothetical protein